jgi:uncharacterized protein DUF2442
MNPRVTAVQYENPYKLILTFANKEVREFDFSSYLGYPVYAILKDEAYCRKARVLNGTVVWDDFVDFDPDTLYLESKPLAMA